MRVGWIEDYPRAPGGAELTALSFRLAAPLGTKIIRIDPSEVVRDDVDIFIVQNCVGLTAKAIPILRTKPVVKYVHDLWPHGDKFVRSWLVSRASLIFTSPAHAGAFSPSVSGYHLVPPYINIERFRASARPENQRTGTIWLGRMDNPGKGIKAAVDWAEAHEPVDFYGRGILAPRLKQTGRVRYMGAIDPDGVPALLGRYSKFLHLPYHFEPFGRSVAEAWASGCKLIVNSQIGATYWFDQPHVLYTARERFWEKVEACL